MAIHRITIGDRQFDVRSPLPLGTFRRVPGAMAALFEFKDRGPAAAGPDFLLSQMSTLVAIIHDNINAPTFKTKAPLIISLEEFQALLDEIDAFDGLAQIADAIVAIFMDTKTLPTTENAQGNASGSESKS